MEERNERRESGSAPRLSPGARTVGHLVFLPAWCMVVLTVCLLFMTTDGDARHLIPLLLGPPILLAAHLVARSTTLEGGRADQGISYYDPCTALGAVIRRIREDRRSAQRPTRLRP